MDPPAISDTASILGISAVETSQTGAPWLTHWFRNIIIFLINLSGHETVSRHGATQSCRWLWCPRPWQLWKPWSGWSQKHQTASETPASTEPSAPAKSLTESASGIVGGAASECVQPFSDGQQHMLHHGVQLQHHTYSMTQWQGWHIWGRHPCYHTVCWADINLTHAYKKDI